MAKALLNIFGVRAGGRVLDPFCGSGTTLVECAHAGVWGCGVDLNPFAVFLANAKLQALAAPVTALRAILGRISSSLASGRRVAPSGGSRIAYLQSWFTPEVLSTVETIRTVIEDAAGSDAPVFLALLSNLLRDYSLQIPRDLRIRRRRTPLPGRPLVDAFLAACCRFLGRLEDAQAIRAPIFRAETPSNATRPPSFRTLHRSTRPSLALLTPWRSPILTRSGFPSSGSAYSSRPTCRAWRRN